jgi:protein CWC15
MEIDDGGEPASVPAKRTIGEAARDADEDEDAETKRRRLILEEAQELDADSAGSSDEESDEE